METALIAEILKSLGEGNMAKGVFLIAIFFVIWLEVRGLKKQMKTLNHTIGDSFAKGEQRFNNIEKDVHQIRLDLDNFKQTQRGVKYGEQSL